MRADKSKKHPKCRAWFTTPQLISRRGETTPYLPGAEPNKIIPMRTLGIDLGSRRVGLALSDEGGKFATPFEVLEIQTEVEATQYITALILKEGIDRLVVGLPLNMDDTIGPAARAAMKWGREISEKSGKPVIFVDERLSSFAAEQSLNERKRGGEKMTRKGKRQRLDAIAAAGFLQAFLDGKLQAIDLR
jgi:putative Holliday junction resolvase